MAAHNEEKYCGSIYENNPALMENEDLDLQHVANVVQYYKSNIDNRQCSKCDYKALVCYIGKILKKLQSGEKSFTKWTFIGCGFRLCLSQFRVTEIMDFDYTPLTIRVRDVIKDSDLLMGVMVWLYDDFEKHINIMKLSLIHI